MRKKKIRGHRRRWKDIEKWRSANLGLDLIDYLKNASDKDYVKIRIRPWSGISLINSIIPEPKGKTKIKILNTLLDIYEDWEKQLSAIGEPYYLKIWLFDPRFSQSQIVCAVGENIDFYKNTFHKPDEKKEFQFNWYGTLKTRLSKFDWEYRLDEDHYDDSDLKFPLFLTSQQDYEEEERWFANLLKKPYRTCTESELMGKIINTYSFTRGAVWLGEKQSKK